MTDKSAFWKYAHLANQLPRREPIHRMLTPEALIEISNSVKIDKAELERAIASYRSRFTASARSFQAQADEEIPAAPKSHDE